MVNLYQTHKTCQKVQFKLEGIKAGETKTIRTNQKINPNKTFETFLKVFSFKTETLKTKVLLTWTQTPPCPSAFPPGPKTKIKAPKN